MQDLSTASCSLRPPRRAFLSGATALVGTASALTLGFSRTSMAASDEELAMNGLFYGIDAPNDGSANSVYKYRRPTAVRFRAELSGAIIAVRWNHRYSYVERVEAAAKANYSYGTGGMIRIELRQDDPRLEHPPLAPSTDATEKFAPLLPGDPNLLGRTLWAGVLACALFACVCHPAAAHQKVDPAVLRLVKPRTGKPPGNIVRPPGDPLVEEGRRLFFKETFGGNGRTCGTCHRAGRNFTIDADFIRRLPKTDPLFVAETNPTLAGLENPNLMRQFGLILENLDGFDQPGVLRGVPHTLGLRFSSGPAAGVPLAGAMGWSGDGAPGDGTLGQFAVGAVVQHFPKTLARQPDRDFRVPTQNELDALLAFQLSLGRQEEIRVDPQDPQALTFRDAAVAAGQRLFHAAPARDGSTRSCAGCHSNAGATTPSGNGLNTDTGVRLAANAPACVDSNVPGDGGFRSEPVQTAALCGREVTFRGDGKFNSTSLVEAADTPPLFHNNSAATIEEAVRFYTTDVFNASPAGGGRAVVLDPAQVNQVAGFLRAINALDNITNARRSLEGAIGRPSLLNLLKDPAVVDINDAIKVLTRGPVRLFASTQPTASLQTALVNIARGQLAQATVDLDRARSLMVGVP